MEVGGAVESVRYIEWTRQGGGRGGCEVSSIASMGRREGVWTEGGDEGWGGAGGQHNGGASILSETYGLAPAAFSPPPLRADRETDGQLRPMLALHWCK